MEEYWELDKPTATTATELVFKSPVHTTRKNHNWTEPDHKKPDHQLQFRLFRNKKLLKMACNWVGLNWLQPVYGTT